MRARHRTEDGDLNTSVELRIRLATVINGEPECCPQFCL